MLRARGGGTAKAASREENWGDCGARNAGKKCRNHITIMTHRMIDEVIARSRATIR